MLQFMPILAVSFAAAYSFTPLTREFALDHNIVDQPNKRKLHQEPIPLLGGLAVYSAFILAFAIAMLIFQPKEYLREFSAVAAGTFWLALVGYVDDRNGMLPRTKMLAQVASGIFLLMGGIQVRLFEQDVLNYGLTIFWVVGITNALNLMDNMDGLAAGITAIASGTFFVLAASQELVLVSSLAAALCGATLGFLKYNFNPASTFMGDAGSLVIGFLLATLGIKLDFPTQVREVSWAIPLLVLGIPIFDTSLVFFTRIREGRSPFQGGKDHTSHRIANMGNSHRRTVVYLYGVAITLGVAALVISRATLPLALGIITIVGIFATSSFVFLETSYQAHKKVEQ